MSFFQNLFDAEYEGYWTLGDYKGYSLTFKVPANKNKGEAFIAWNTEPYDLSASGNLTINFAYDPEFKNFASLTVNVAGATPGATLASEIRDILNSTAGFSDWFTAGIDNSTRGGGERAGGPFRLFIRQKKSNTAFRTYVSNTGAELKLKFNKFAGVADIPSYFEKDTIANRFATPESNGRLIRLSHVITGNTAANPSVVTSVAHGLSTNDVVYFVDSNSTPTLNGSRVATVTGLDTFTVPVNVTTAGTTGEWLNANEYQIVTDYGLDYSAMLGDWAHLRGRTSSYMFAKNTIDGSDRITTQIVWQAGAKAGQLAKKIVNTYSGANTTPSTAIELPYVLTASDLLTP
jgi:hypothetical protein